MDPKTEEFIRLLEIAGWSQAEAARRLQVTPGAVSQLCSGRTRPRPSTLNLLKLMIAREKPEALRLHERTRAATLEPWENDLLDALRKTPPAERERLLPIFKQMIKAITATARKDRGSA